MFNLKFKIIFIFLLLFAFTIAITQPFGYSPDYTQYEFFFQQIRFDFIEVMLASRFEPGFSILSGGLTWLFSSNIIVYSVLVIIAIYLKTIFTRKLSINNYFYLAIVYYFSKFFILHELTQLRVALAASFIFVAIYFLWNGMRWKGILSCAFAVSFHYSTLMMLPFLFIKKLNRINSIGVALLIYIILSLTARNAVDIAGSYFSVFQMYETNDALFNARAINPLSPVLFPEFFLLLAAFLFWNDMTEKMQKIVTIQLIGFAIFYAFIDYQVVAVRGREFFSVLWTLFIAQAGACKNRFKLITLIFIASSIVLSIYQYFYLDFFTY